MAILYSKFETKSHQGANCLARNVRSIRPLAYFVCAVLTALLAATTIQAQATIEVDFASGAGDFDSLGTRTSLIWSHTIINKTNRILIVGVSTSVNGALGPNADRVISVTYNGQALTAVGSLRSPLPGTRSSTEMFSLVSPPVGTANVVVTLAPLPLGNYAVGGSVSFTGVDQTTPSGAFVSNSGTNASPTVNVPSAAGELVIDNVATSPDALNLSAGAGQTERYNGAAFVSSTIAVGAGSTEPGASSVTMSWTSTLSGDWAIGAISLKPAATPTAANGNVSGQIVDNSGHPVEGAAVRMSGTQNRLTVTDAAGNYHFDNVETNGLYTVVPSRSNFTFSPSQRAFSQLGQHTDAAFSANATGNGLNPLDATEYFVRQQYLDFLGREPDEAGLNYWVNNIESCGADQNCRAVARINTSGAFFLSIEFQQTGYLVYRTYQAAYGDIPGAPVPIRLNEFRPDTAEIGNGVVVLQSGWEQQLNNNKQAYTAEFVQRGRFVTAYPTTLTPAEFVDRLFANASVAPAASDRTAAINEFGAAVTTSDVAARGRALRRVAENSVLAQQEFNQGFVLMQYFGYLQRDANSGPDTDYSGYNFWLDKLNTFNGNFQNAEMVNAFLVSSEYRGRFPR